MGFLALFFWQSKFAIPRMNWGVLVLVMINMVTQTKFVRLVAETGQNCVTDIDGDWFSRCFHICRKQRICLNDDSLPWPGFSKPDQANPGLVKFSISISDPATSTSSNGGKLGLFVLFSTSQFRHFGRESVSYSQTNWQESFDLIRD